MAKIEDYALADCTLFRIPEINYAKYNEEISNALLEAWKNGYSADQAIKNIFKGSIAKDIKDTINKSLEFQKEKLYENVDIESKKKIEEMLKSKETLLKESETNYSEKESQTAAKLKDNNNSYTETTKVYSSSQSKLEALKIKIEEKRKKLGKKPLEDIIKRDAKKSFDASGSIDDKAKTPENMPYADQQKPYAPDEKTRDTDEQQTVIPNADYEKDKPKASFWKKILRFFGYKK